MEYDNRKSSHDINKLILERWSPRAYISKPIDQAKLSSILEAAHWAPSCFNEQPWRFIVSQTEQERSMVLDFLAESNKVWAKNVPLFVILITCNEFSQNSKQNRYSGFDAGCAWGFFALEARRQGLYAHAMAGFNKEKAREQLKVPENFDIMAVIAVGEKAESDILPEELQKRERPSDRKNIEDLTYYGRFEL